MIVSAGFYSMGSFLIAFLGITGIWFAVKAMCKYGMKYVKHTPVCEFDKKGVILYDLSIGTQKMNYKDIKEVKILRDRKSVKLFFSGTDVKHPSGWYYAGAIYLFQRSLLDEVEQKSMKCLADHNVTVRKVEKR